MHNPYPGPDNDVVDALLHSLFSKAQKLVPRLLILLFKPPHEVPGGIRMLIDITPGSRQKAHEPWTLEKLYHKRCLALGSAIDTATLGPYNSALNSYITFCKIHHFPVQPTVDTMSYFIVFMSSHIKPESVSFYLSGICNRLENFFLMFVRLGTPQS